MKDAQARLDRAALHGLLWSLTKNWGGRLLALAAFTVLARFLDPRDFGIAAAASLILLFLGMTAEFGFGDALVQAPALAREDPNLPFFVAMAASVGLGILVAAGAGAIERRLAVTGLRRVLAAMAGMAPLVTAALFLEAMYRRALAFRKLAVRALAANLIAGPLAIGCAACGLGVWALVVHAYASALVGILWLARGAPWTPAWAFRRGTFRILGRFGASVFSVRLVEFVSTRAVEFLIATRFGLAALGLYAVALRLQKSLTQLLQASINDVALPVLSRIAHDRERLARAYLRIAAGAAHLAAPLFVLAAALAPGICALLLGARWRGAAELARPLLLLAGLQCVQFLNGPYLASRGHPERVLLIAAIRSAGTVLGLLLVPAADVAGLTRVFVATQVLFAPVSFHVVTRELGIPWSRLIAELSPATLACVVAYGGAALARPRLSHPGHAVLVREAAVGMVFLACYSACGLLFGRRRWRASWQFVLDRWRRP